MVRRRWGDSDAQTKLQDGDVILEIDGEVMRGLGFKGLGVSCVCGVLGCMVLIFSVNDVCCHC